MFREHEKTVHSLKEKLREADRYLDDFSRFLKVFPDSKKQLLIENSDINGRGFSLEEVAGEAKRTVRAILAIRSPRYANLSSERLSNLLTAASALHASCSEIDRVRFELESDNRSFIYDGVRVVTFLSRDEMYNFEPLAESIFSNLENLRSAASGMALVSQNSDPEIELEQSIASLAARASEVLKKVQVDSEVASQFRQEAEQKLAEFQGLSDRLKAEAEELSEKSRRATSSTASYSEEAAANLETMRGHEEHISSQRSRVHDLVEASQSDRSRLAEFSEELTAVKDNLSYISSKAEADKKRQDDYISHAESLIEKAEGMLKGATVAGLAVAFDRERRELQEGMDNAMIWFIVGIAILFVVTFLLAAYVFEIPFSVFGVQLSGSGSTDTVGDEVTIAGVISRTIILLAPFWLTLFSARRYRNLFDLRQQYSHKYNLAFSIDGFRKQAPSYEEELAAWVFHEISQRPITTNSRKIDDNPVPTLQAIVSATIERTNLFKHKTKSEAKD